VSKAKLMFNMSVKEVREGMKQTKTVIVPIGITEQHGYHMPLSVDIHNAAEIAKRASDETGCFVAPTLHYAFSGGMLPGTINVSPQVYSLLLMDICRSLVTQGFKNVVLLIGHGGSENTKATMDAAEMFQRLSPDISGITISVVGFWDLSPTYMKSFDEQDYHAARYETSMMLYWHPELVHMENACLDDPDLVHRMRTDPDAYLEKTKVVDGKYVVPKLTQHRDIQVGVMGALEGISAELGEKIVREATESLAQYVRELEGK